MYSLYKRFVAFFLHEKSLTVGVDPSRRQSESTKKQMSGQENGVALRGEDATIYGPAHGDTFWAVKHGKRLDSQRKKGEIKLSAWRKKSKNDWLNTTVSRFVTGVVRLVANELFQPFASQSLYIFQCEQGSWICGRKQQSWRRKLCAHSLAKYRRLPSSIPLHRHEHFAGEPATMPFKKNFNSFYSDSIAITPVSSDDIGHQIVCKIAKRQKYMIWYNPLVN